MPAGDIGVGAREVGYLFGQYKRLKNASEAAVLTGKGLTFGGSLTRTEATGYGLCYLTAEMLKTLKNDSFSGKTVVISGSGNVAIFACEKATELGAKVVAMSDSNGYIHDPDGIKLDIIKDIKLVKRGRIKEYAAQVPGSTYTEGFRGIWTIPCDIALPCATQNEITAALHSRGHRHLPEGRSAVRSGQGSQRRRRGSQRAGDEPELHALLLDL